MSQELRYELQIEAYRQNWEQIRHTENLRMWFSSVYGSIVAALVAFMSVEPDTNDWQVFAFLAGWSFFGLLVNWRAAVSIGRHRQSAVDINRDLGGQKYHNPFGQPGAGPRTAVPLRILFPVMYLVACLLFLSLSITS